MCYHTKLTAKTEKIEGSLKAQFIEPDRYVPHEEINAFDFRATPVITDENPGEIQFYQWGLIPHWAENDEIKKMTLNARIETADEKPAFRDAVDQRCLVIAEGFYEWHWFDTKGREKQKYLIRPTDQEVFAFAGIYSSWKDPKNGAFVNSYSILTTQANDLMSEIHNTKKRMPIILSEDDRKHWLEHQNLSDFAFPYEVPLEAEKIGNSGVYRLF